MNHDPAPSRLAYRLHRLWLTPAFWRALRLWVPLGFVVLSAVLWLADAERRQALAAGAIELRRQIAQRPEFLVQEVFVEGATDPVATRVRASLEMELPVSSFDIDLAELRERAAALDAIKAASVGLQPGGTLTVRVEERVPAVLHRMEDGLTLRDENGYRISRVSDQGEAPDLPLIAGAGGQEAVGEALALYAAARPIAAQLRGLVRVGERRWDAVLTGERRVLLPEQNPVSALEQVIALDQAHDLLARQVPVIDMRDPARPTLRLGDHALDELHRIRAETAGSSSR